MADDERQGDTRAPRNIRGMDERLHRLFVYRAGVTRMTTEMDQGAPPAQAVWRTACDLTETFNLNQRDSGLLAGCLVTAMRSR
jgi:hypothetical protein